MSYIGKIPATGNFVKLDAISVVNGQASYTMQSGSVNFTPESANHMLVSLNGVIQAPITSFSVSGSTITFASALSTGDVINFIMVYGNVLDIGTPSDDTISASKLQTDSVIEAKIQNDAVTRDKINAISTSSLPSFEAKGTSGQTDGYIQLNCEQNSHGIKLKSPSHSSAQSYTIIMPDNQIAQDKFMKVKSITGSGSTAVGQLEFADAGGGGKILQVVQNVKSDTGSWTGTQGRTDTGLSATITPSASTSKILMLWNITIGYESSASQWFLHLDRGGTEIGQGDTAGSRKFSNHNPINFQNINEEYICNTETGSYLDTPNTTNATTYKVQHSHVGAGNTFYINRSHDDRQYTGYDSRAISNIILMEIGA